MKNFGIILALIIGTFSAEAATIQFAGQDSNDQTIFKYTLQLHNERVVAGDFFTIFDFAGFEGATTPANWAASTMLNAANVANDATRSDVTFTYTGSTPLAVAPNGSPLALNFTINSLYSVSRTDDYYTRTTHYSNTTKKVTAQGTLTVADVFVPTTPETNPVPEPGTMATLGAGLIAVGLGYRRRSA